MADLGFTLRICVGAAVLSVLACRMDNPEFDAQATETQRPGDGDADDLGDESSDTKSDTSTAPGDGDGDTSSTTPGDGDGDTGPGDGDGDGDGDTGTTGPADTDTGDGDGDGDTNNGDGDGDGDTNGIVCGEFQLADHQVCQGCIDELCCDVAMPCLDSQPCSCMVECVLGGQPAETCQGVCQFDGPAYDALFGCMQESCTDECFEP